MSEKNLKLSKSEASQLLWKKGILYWKLNSAQKKVYELVKKSPYRIPVVHMTRRGGKSYVLLTIAMEYCMQNPGVTVHYVCGTSVMATKIIKQNMPEILKDCPEDLRPKYYKHDRCFVFHTGSKLQIEGADEGNAERLRGTSTHLGIVDEAGFIKDLEYLVNDILLPQTLTTKGKIILSSSSPKTVGHSFIKFIEKAKLQNSYIIQTIEQVLEEIKNDPKHLREHLNPSDVEEIKKASGGADSTTWRREYLCHIITDTESAVVPEFTAELEAQIVKDHPRPDYYDPYTAMDPGLVDNTGLLFAYLDFNEAKLVIEDEFLINGNKVTTENIANEVKLRERKLWTDNHGHFRQVYMRISDNEPILLNDLNTMHNLVFIPAKKDNKEAAINDLRIKIAQGKILINPRCKNLIFQLKTATWASNRRTFDRSKEAGHFDLVDALIYLVRMTLWHKNPFPNQGINVDYQFSPKKTNNLSETQQKFKDLFIKKGSNK
jgi:hypothetical protein